jgi:hypothetical protein
MSPYTHCQECQLKLEHVTLFCSECGRSACSWSCHAKHRDRHDPTPQTRPAPSTAEARQKAATAR